MCLHIFRLFLEAKERPFLLLDAASAALCTCIMGGSNGAESCTMLQVAQLTCNEYPRRALKRQVEGASSPDEVGGVLSGAASLTESDRLLCSIMQPASPAAASSRFADRVRFALGSAWPARH